MCAALSQHHPLHDHFDPFNVFGSSASKGCRVSLEPISNIKKNLLHLYLPEDKLGLLASKYRGIPEVYYEHDKPITPSLSTTTSES